MSLPMEDTLLIEGSTKTESLYSTLWQHSVATLYLTKWKCHPSHCALYNTQWQQYTWQSVCFQHWVVRRTVRSVSIIHSSHCALTLIARVDLEGQTQIWDVTNCVVSIRTVATSFLSSNMRYLGKSGYPGIYTLIARFARQTQIWDVTSCVVWILTVASCFLSSNMRYLGISGYLGI